MLCKYIQTISHKTCNPATAWHRARATQNTKNAIFAGGLIITIIYYDGMACLIIAFMLSGRYARVGISLLLTDIGCFNAI